MHITFSEITGRDTVYPYLDFPVLLDSTRHNKIHETQSFQQQKFVPCGLGGRRCQHGGILVDVSFLLALKKHCATSSGCHGVRWEKSTVIRIIFPIVMKHYFFVHCLMDDSFLFCLQKFVYRISWCGFKFIPFRFHSTSQICISRLFLNRWRFQPSFLRALIFQPSSLPIFIYSYIISVYSVSSISIYLYRCRWVWGDNLRKCLTYLQRFGKSRIGKVDQQAGDVDRGCGSSVNVLHWLSSLFMWEDNSFLLKPSNDWMQRTHMMESNRLCSNSTELKQYLHRNI